jgi:hypothetical protein
VVINHGGTESTEMHGVYNSQIDDIELKPTIVSTFRFAGKNGSLSGFFYLSVLLCGLRFSVVINHGGTESTEMHGVYNSRLTILN